MLQMNICTFHFWLFTAHFSKCTESWNICHFWVQRWTFALLAIAFLKRHQSLDLSTFNRWTHCKSGWGQQPGLWNVNVRRLLGDSDSFLCASVLLYLKGDDPLYASSMADGPCTPISSVNPDLMVTSDPCDSTRLIISLSDWRIYAFKHFRTKFSSPNALYRMCLHVWDCSVANVGHVISFEV